MRISSKDWKNYIEKLSKLNNTAGEKMSDYVARHGFDDPKIIDYAYGLVTKYGEGSASLSAMMYDAIAEMEGKILPSAEVAETPKYGEVAKAINGVRKHSQNPTSYGNVVNRLVKRTGADTMLQNAERDGAEFAWIPSGDTCAFCIALASRGWQHISKKSLKNGHAEHIHANCDCNYTVRFDGKSTVAGYNPEEYLEIYESAEGDTPEEKINSIRAKYRTENRDKINAQKRANYAEKKNILVEGRNWEYEKQRKIILSDEIVSEKTDKRDLKVRKDINNPREVYISINTSIKPKELQNIISDIDEAIHYYKGDINHYPRIVVVSKEENREEVIASYNSVNNTIYILPQAGNREKILEFQKELAAEKNPKSSTYHEIWHWVQAERYRQDHGEINENNVNEYNKWIYRKSKEHLDKAGISVENVREISYKAYMDYKDDILDEVEAEFQTALALKGVKR